MTSSRLRKLALAGALGLALALALRAFLFGIYRVSSESMLPWLAKDDRVLVWFERAPELGRFALAVLQRPGDSAPIVKRVAGLPGESIQLAGGDLLIDGRRLASSAPRPPPIPLFDQELLALADWFWLDPVGPWHVEEHGASVRVDALAIESAGHEQRLHYHKGFSDGWLAESGFEPGAALVNDGAVECSVRFEAPRAGARFVLALSEDADEFEAWIEVLPGGRARLAILRHSEGRLEPAATLAEREVELDLDAAIGLSFSNIDNALAFSTQSASANHLLAVAYDSNRPRADGLSRAGGGRASLGAEGAVAVVRRIRVLRDAWWKPQGAFAVNQALVLGPDEIFLLGDHSLSSVDSRLWGPVSLEDVLGVPVALVWPPGRWRGL